LAGPRGAAAPVRNSLRRPLINWMSRNPVNEALFKQWLDSHKGIIFKATWSFAHTPADAADLRQEILLQLWNSIPAYKGAARESTWIYRVCLNTALSWRRNANRRTARIDPEADLGGIAAGAASPADDAAHREMLEKLYGAIHALGDLDRVLVLLMLDGLAYREMAEITGQTENSVGVALTRARKRLAAIMKGVTDELE